MKTTWIGICGGSASGKSTVADAVDMLYHGHSLVISLDSYYKPHDSLTFEERDIINFDHPTSFDFELLEKQLELLKHSTEVDMPQYSFKEHTRLNYTKKIFLKPIVIVEGMLILYRPKIRELLDLKVYIELNEEIRLCRMIDRDIKERNRSLEKVKDQYFRDVKPMHELYVEPQKQYADEIIDGSQDVANIAIHIQKLVSRK